MKACDIYKTENTYKIITQSETDTGLLFSNGPILLLPINTNIEELKNGIFSCLHKSISNVKMPDTKDEFSKWQKEFLKIIQEKSFVNLYRKSSNCEIRLNDNILKIYPSIYSEKYKGMVAVKDKIIEMKYSKDDELYITNKIIEILEGNIPNLSK